MKETTFIDRIIDWILWPYYEVQYYFAMSWLNTTFGEHDYWGDKIMELIAAQEQLDEMKAQIDANLKSLNYPL